MFGFIKSKNNFHWKATKKLRTRTSSIHLESHRNLTSYTRNFLVYLVIDSNADDSNLCDWKITNQRFFLKYIKSINWNEMFQRVWRARRPNCFCPEKNSHKGINYANHKQPSCKYWSRSLWQGKKNQFCTNRIRTGKTVH